MAAALGDEQRALVRPPVRAALLQRVGEGPVQHLHLRVQHGLQRRSGGRHEQLPERGIQLRGGHDDDAGTARAVAELEHDVASARLQTDLLQDLLGQVRGVAPRVEAGLRPQVPEALADEAVVRNLLALHQQRAPQPHLVLAVLGLIAFPDEPAMLREARAAAVAQLQHAQALPRRPAAVVLQVHHAPVGSWRARLLRAALAACRRLCGRGGAWCGRPRA
mmetsp:Transcript_52386/g.135189  ORF Transcript_52386/g.135189 Transcript_52386/m.135189 type:complete len:220 (-) Transcript_52386:49-708(-)